jgi:hypothetical protein
MDGDARAPLSPYLGAPKEIGNLIDETVVDVSGPELLKVAALIELHPRRCAPGSATVNHVFSPTLSPPLASHLPEFLLYFQQTSAGPAGDGMAAPSARHRSVAHLGIRRPKTRRPSFEFRGSGPERLTTDHCPLPPRDLPPSAVDSYSMRRALSSERSSFHS